MADGTRTQQLVEAKLGEALVPWAMTRRPQSWRHIATELREASGIDIAPETLRLWCAADEAERVSA